MQSGISQLAVEHLEVNQVGDSLIVEADIVGIRPEGSRDSTEALGRILVAWQGVPYFLFSGYECIRSELSKQIDDNWELIRVSH